MSSPRMASENSSDGKIESFEWPVFSKRFKSILGACGSETAGCRGKGGNAGLVKAYQKHKRKYCGLPEDKSCLIFHYLQTFGRHC